jgi:peptide/nickel transport system substrate-binding protein
MNYKLLALGLLALIITLTSIIPPLAMAQQAQGQPLTEIYWKTSTQEAPAILQVAQGQADVFAWSVPLPRYDSIDPQYRQNLKLVRSTTTYVDIALNPAANVIDPNKPGVVELADKNLTGQQIPGLLVWDPPTNWVNWTDLGTSIPWSKVHFNPWGIREMRYALEFLVDRDLIVRKIYGGSAAPALGAIRPSHPWYPHAKEIYEEMGLTPTGDKQKAQQIFLNALQKVKAIYQQYGMDLVLKDDPTEPGGKWLYFVKPWGIKMPK